MEEESTYAYRITEKSPAESCWIPRLRGICMEQMEDGFGEALLKEGVGRDRTACYSGRVSRT
ncbi:MAG: hypothetical protein Q4C77_14605 [Eubacteriales bacterium]|nr:hypothetical protein [Eubacteriales bacterium]